MAKIVNLSQKKFTYAVFGMLMGDGCLSKNNNGKRIYLIIEHGPKQAAYAQHKASFLKQHSIWVNVSKRDTKQFGGEYIVTTVRARLRPGVLRHLNKFDRVYRDNTTKVFSAYVARRITALGLFYWFMDDGTSSVSEVTKPKRNMTLSRTYRLGTYGFDDVSKRRITECLRNRFGIETKIIKAGSGRTLHNLGVKGMRQLIEVVNPYLSSVPKCMRYKFDMQYQNDNKYSRWSADTIASKAEHL